MTDQQQRYSKPSFQGGTFHCPICKAYSKQRWGYPAVNYEGVSVNANPKAFAASRCDNCSNIAIWIGQNLIYPVTISSVSPNSDLSDEIKEDFEEARKIVNESPRGAAALLRLAVQKLCIDLGEDGKNINADIASLVSKGLPVKIQQALDVVRVVGNNAVHPGSLDVKDDIESANQLFALVNLIAEVMISQPKHVEALYESLVPDSVKESIDKRDRT